MTVIVFISLAFQILGAMLAKRTIRRKQFYRKRSRPITILKPMKGIDDALELCVSSFLRLVPFDGDEIIFCFESSSDPAYKTVEGLINYHYNFHRGTARVMCFDSKVVANPKINNIWQAYRLAKNDLILISDSNVVAPNDYKQIMDAEFTTGIGVLTSLVYSSGRGLDAMMLNTFYTKWILILNFIGQPTVIGKSMMFDRRLLNLFGGLAEAGQYLAEDFAIGKMFKSRGADIKISSVPVRQSVSTSGFWGRYMRWGIMRKAQAPWVFLVEPLVYGTVAQTIAWGLFSWPIALLYGAIWCFCDDVISTSVSGSKFHFVAYTLREWSAVPMWLQTLFNNTVTWRGREYVIERGGKAIPKN
jgi:ceramide glucosyltransferase